MFILAYPNKIVKKQDFIETKTTFEKNLIQIILRFILKDFILYK